MAAMTTINTQALIIAHSNTLPTSADAALAPMALSGLPALSEFALATLRLIAYALRSTDVLKLIAEMQPFFNDNGSVPERLLQELNNLRLTNLTDNKCANNDCQKYRLDQCSEFVCLSRFERL